MPRVFIISLTSSNQRLWSGFVHLLKTIQFLISICPTTPKRIRSRWEPIARDILLKRRNVQLKTDERQSGGQKLAGNGASVHNKAFRKSEWKSRYRPPDPEQTDPALSARVSQTRSADGECFLSSVCTVCVCSLPPLFFFCVRWGRVMMSVHGLEI